MHVLLTHISLFLSELSSPACHAVNASVYRCSALLVLLKHPVDRFLIVCLGRTFKQCEHSFSLPRDQTLHDFLGNIFGRVVEQVFQLQACELANDILLFADHQRVLSLKLVKSLFFFEHVFNKSPSSVGHFSKSIAESHLKHFLVYC